MKRRTFVKNGILASSALSFSSFASRSNKVGTDNVFKMKFSPEFGIFGDVAGSNPAGPN